MFDREIQNNFKAALRGFTPLFIGIAIVVIGTLGVIGFLVARDLQASDKSVNQSSRLDI